MKYKEALQIAQQKCLVAGVGEQAPLFLLLELSNKEAHSLYMEYEKDMDALLLQEYMAKVDRLLTQEPLDHILGYSYFYGYQFLVNEHVLIPRPETEELVANVLAAYDEHFEGQPVTVLDVGSGSGAIAIALCCEEPNMTVIASDISEDAVRVAQKNAQNLNAKVQFLVGNMLEPFMEKAIKADILVSNPPYIPQQEEMEASVVDFEPHVALFGGTDGLKFYREIFKHAHKVVNPKSILAFEIGYNQKDSLTREAKQYFPNATIEVLKDMNGKDRMLLLYNDGKNQ